MKVIMWISAANWLLELFTFAQPECFTITWLEFDSIYFSPQVPQEK